MQWLRRRFIAGFFVSVPLVISVAALVWIFGIIDGLTAPLAARVLGRRSARDSGSCHAAGGAGGGAVATNVIGRRVVARGERWLMRIPVFRTIYAPVKQLVVAFSPDNEYGFKRVVHGRGPARAAW